MSVGIYVVLDKAEVALDNYQFSKEEKEKLSKLLSRLFKVCMKCHTVQKDILILNCSCMFCKGCLKSELLSLNKALVSNSLEAACKREAVCVCGAHGWRVSPRILGEVFSGEELETFAVQAMGRRVKGTRKERNKYPNLCADCKLVLCDSSKNWINICYRHKLCKACFE